MSERFKPLAMALEPEALLKDWKRWYLAMMSECNET
jgi:hypothetical protein